MEQQPGNSPVPPKAGDMKWRLSRGIRGIDFDSIRTQQNLRQQSLTARGVGCRG
jgi:hypothetical protein